MRIFKIRKYILDKIRLIHFKKADKNRSKDIDLMVELWGLYSKMGVTKYDKLFNACIYSSLVNRDIYYLAEYYYFEKNKKRKNFFGRLLSMTIIEYLDDVNFLLGKELQDELKENEMNNFLEHIRTLNKFYSQIKKEYNFELRLIRNNAAAHKTRDAKFLYEIQNDLPVKNLTQIGYSIGKLESIFVEISTEILIETHKVHGPNSPNK